MLPFDHPLFIYEIRCQKNCLKQIDTWPQNVYGPYFLGLHLEEEFAFIFFKNDPKKLMAKLLEDNQFLELSTIHEMSYGQWQDGANTETFKVGILKITPHRQSKEETSSENELIIKINPGLAFGFGGHPTTKACLELLLKVIKRSPNIKNALDLGCGTGILSLAAAKLGIENIIAVDYSHLAAENAILNVNLNNLSKNIEIFKGEAQNFSNNKAELLMANLHFSLQEELLNLKAFENRKNVILSGLFPDEGEKLRLLIENKTNLKIKDQIRNDRWSSLWLTAKP